MSKITIILTCFFIFLLQTLYTTNCFAQVIDQEALNILKASSNKISNQKSLVYSILYSYSEGDEKRIMLKDIDASYINLLDQDQILYYFLDGSAKYVTKDSIYMAELKPQKVVRAIPNTAIHVHSSYNIQHISLDNMLGTTQNFADECIDTIRFNKNIEMNEYIIDVVEKKRTWNNGTIQSIVVYDRYWIDKKSLFPNKRKSYRHSKDDLGKEKIDIYEFTLSFPEKSPVVGFPLDIFKAGKYRNLKNPIVPAESNKQILSMLGQLAPKFSGTNLVSGKKEKISDYKGKIILLDFWYLSCAPCRSLMPILNQLNEKFKDKDFVLLGVNVMDMNNDEIKNYVNEKKYHYEQWYNPLGAKELYNLASYPTTVLIDKAGHIKFYDTGYSDDMGSILSKLIENELNR